jgi:alpha-glucoside transport system permease protein
MVTPTLMEEPPSSRPPGTVGEGRAPAPLLYLIRLIASLLVPVFTVVVLVVAFNYLRDQNANRLLQVIVAIIVGVVGVWALYWGMDRFVGALPERLRAGIRPFVFAGPAAVILTVYLVYPAVNTVIISFMNRNSSKFVGLQNYIDVFTTHDTLISIRNSILWVVIVPAVVVAIGLGFATLADKLGRRAESFSKSLIFLPMAVSFVGASVVWGFVYNFRPTGFGNQIGILNALLSAVGGTPVNWLTVQPWNTAFLMVIMIWTQVGFAMVILSSAIKAVPEDILEAARIDGATEIQVFWRVVFPSVASTVVVVWTTVVITVWKLFDIVYVMTGGRDGTTVIAEKMVTEFFKNFNFGAGAALAVILFVAVTPVLVVNIRRFQAEEAIR